MCCRTKGPTPSDFPTCKPGFECTGGKCLKTETCGAKSQACCADKGSEPCNSGLECISFLVADTNQDVCETSGCGKTGGDCCGGTFSCRNGNTDRCSAKSQCQAIICGKEGEECCLPNGDPPPDFTGCQNSLKCVQKKCTKAALKCGRLGQRCCKSPKKCLGRLRCRREICVRN
jgi:hypothetical protein